MFLLNVSQFSSEVWLNRVRLWWLVPWPDYLASAHDNFNHCFCIQRPTSGSTGSPTNPSCWKPNTMVEILLIPAIVLDHAIGMWLETAENLYGWHCCSCLTTSHTPSPLLWCLHARAVQDYDLYWIHIDYFKRIQLQYASSCILSNMITVEYDTITLWLQYNMMCIFNHNVIVCLSIRFGTCQSTTQF